MRLLYPPAGSSDGSTTPRNVWRVPYGQRLRLPQSRWLRRGADSRLGLAEHYDRR